jgi:hypothetical protein
MGGLGVLAVSLAGLLGLGLDLVYSSFSFGHGSEMNSLHPTRDRCNVIPCWRSFADE